jgi:hypothetical protein
MSSRNRRLTRFRLTAVPNRLPTTMPTLVPSAFVRQTRRLKNAVELRRPCRLTNSMSRLARKNSPLSPCRAGAVTDAYLDAGSPTSGQSNPHAATIHGRRKHSSLYGKRGGARDLARILHRCRTYTVRRVRPLARRRAKTFRPFLVLMRFRNPCSRFFLRLDGC